MKKLISIIIPAYNEEENLPSAITRVNAVADSLSAKYDFEMIIMDNASRDRTGGIAREQCRADPRWKYLIYSRNFGAEASMLAGLDHAQGDAVINVFSDMQDPPEYIPEMVQAWEAGAQIVYGVLRERNDYSIFKTIGAKLAYKLIRRLADTSIPENATDFRLLDRVVVDAVRQLREPDRYLRGLIHWLGFRTDSFIYDRAKREGGTSSANLIYCIRFALHAIACFSSKPLRFAMIFGVLLTSSSAVMGVFYLSVHLFKPSFLTPPPAGATTVILLILMLLGFNSLFLGIIGEYIGRIYNQGKERPLYIVADRAGFSPPHAAPATDRCLALAPNGRSTLRP
jgi:dolichol-phosphate mannosyltransferase